MPWVHLDIAGTGYFRKATAVRAARRDRRLARDARRAGARRRAGRAGRRATRQAGAAWNSTRRSSRSSPGSRARVLGFGADRLATRWPEHDEERAPGRPTGRLADRRRARCVGALAFGAPARCGSPAIPLALALFGAWFVTLVVGLATDLDQRLLPDVLTLPVIPVALVYAVSGAQPARRRRTGSAALVAAIVIPAVLYLPSIPFGAGAFGMGDVKLLAGIGPDARRRRAPRGRARRAARSPGVVLVVLLAARRIGRRSYIPFGPFLIIGALWAVLILQPA